MLDGIKRWLGGAAKADSPEWQSIASWAEQHQYGLRWVPDEGFVVDGRLGATPWRLEWGPSQRPYIQGQEVRLRSELGLGSDLQMLVMNRRLAEQMEKAVFDQYVEGVQTRLDNQTPPEMRWLVMFDGPLAAQLQGLRVEEGVPVVLMIGRGRLMLRTPQAEPDVAQLQAWVRFAECAIREARRVEAENPESGPQSEPPSVWQQSALPGSEHDR